MGEAVQHKTVGGRLEGRAAVVTGAASGIGRASASLFASEGARVLGVDLPGSDLDAAAEAGGFAPLEVSVTDADAPDRIIQAAQDQLGGLDILFNNAGVSSRVLAENMTDEDWDRVMDVNIRAVFRLTRAAIPLLKASAAGRLLSTASVMAEGAGFGLAPYCASKAGVAGFTRSMALELGKHGVTANYILPGAIKTGMTLDFWTERPDVAELWARKSVLRRLGEPTDVAKAALFLVSDDAAFVTGQGVAVDGGIGLEF